MYKTNINKYILHVLSIKLRDKLHFSFSISTPGFPHFYYMLGANLGVLLYGDISVMIQKRPWLVVDKKGTTEMTLGWACNVCSSAKTQLKLYCQRVLVSKAFMNLSIIIIAFTKIPNWKFINTQLSIFSKCKIPNSKLTYPIKWKRSG